MRYHLLIAVDLILGAITTVAVAWAAAIVPAFPREFDDFPVDAASPSGPGYELLRVTRQDRIGASRLWSSWIDPNYPVASSFSWNPHETPESICPAWTRLVLPSSHNGNWDEHLRMEEATGWPVPALWSGFVECWRHGRHVIEPRVLAYMSDYHWTIPIKERSDPADGDLDTTSMWQLPVLPIWPGFVIDTLFYAAIWFGLFFSFARAKQFIRTKRGRCPRCGYDLRGNLSAGCPECGWNRGASEPRP